MCVKEGLLSLDALILMLVIVYLCRFLTDSLISRSSSHSCSKSLDKIWRTNVSHAFHVPTQYEAWPWMWLPDRAQAICADPVSLYSFVYDTHVVFLGVTAREGKMEKRQLPCPHGMCCQEFWRTADSDSGFRILSYRFRYLERCGGRSHLLHMHRLFGKKEEAFVF